MAGSFVLQDGLHCHWCNLSLFVEPLQFVQLPCEGACMHAKCVLTLPVVGGRDTLCSCRLVMCAGVRRRLRCGAHACLVCLGSCQALSCFRRPCLLTGAGTVVRWRGCVTAGVPVHAPDFWGVRLAQRHRAVHSVICNVRLTSTLASHGRTGSPNMQSPALCYRHECAR